MERKVGSASSGLRPSEARLEAAEAARERALEPPPNRVRFADADTFVSVPRKRPERERVTRPTLDDIAQEREFDAATPSMAEAQRKSARVTRPLFDEVKIRIDMLDALASSEPDSEKEVLRREKILDRADQLGRSLDKEIVTLEAARDQARALSPADIRIADFEARIGEARRLKAELVASCGPIEDQMEDFWADTGTP